MAWHNNLFQAYILSQRKDVSHAGQMDVFLQACQVKPVPLPTSAFTQFRDYYEEPSVHEGFSEIKKVNFMFEGTDEEKREWMMWLQ